jgi:hypothetical protein
MAKYTLAGLRLLLFGKQREVRHIHIFDFKTGQDISKIITMIITVTGDNSVKYWTMEKTVEFQLPGSRYFSLCYHVENDSGSPVYYPIGIGVHLPGTKGGWNVTIHLYLIMTRDAPFTCAFLA